MKYIETKNIPLEDIDASDRLRPLNIDWVLALKESIEKTGLKEPIEVVATPKGPKKFRLIAGGHRLEAHFQAKLDEIRAEIKETITGDFDNECRLHEIDENLIRNELNPLDRAVFLGKRQEIYEAMYPEAAAGKAGAAGKHNPANEIISFAENTAEAIGLGKRTIQRATAIFKALDPATRAKIQGTSLAYKEGELYKLSRYEPDKRAAIVDRCVADNVGVDLAAADILGQRTEPRDPTDIAFDQLIGKWKGTNKAGKRAFLDHLKNLGIIKTYDEGQLA